MIAAILLEYESSVHSWAREQIGRNVCDLFPRCSVEIRLIDGFLLLLPRIVERIFIPSVPQHQTATWTIKYESETSEKRARTATNYEDRGARVTDLCGSLAQHPKIYRGFENTRRFLMHDRLYKRLLFFSHFFFFFFVANFLRAPWLPFHDRWNFVNTDWHTSNLNDSCCSLSEKSRIFNS